MADGTVGLLRANFLQGNLLRTPHDSRASGGFRLRLFEIAASEFSQVPRPSCGSEQRNQSRDGQLEATAGLLQGLS